MHVNLRKYDGYRKWAALTSIGSDFYHNNELQINIQSKGYPTRPSNDVSIVCMMAEKKFKEIVSSNFKILKSSSIKYLVNAVLQAFLFSGAFSSLNLHAIECSTLENHIFLLIKCIEAKYLEIRFHHASKAFSASIQIKKKPKAVNYLINYFYSVVCDIKY